MLKASIFLVRDSRVDKTLQFDDMRALNFVELNNMLSDETVNAIFIEIQAMIEVLKLKCNEAFHND